MRARALAAAPLVLLTGCGPSYDATTLADRVGRTFAHLYVLSAAQDGRTDLDVAALPAQARCERGGPGTPDRGPGDDWRCAVVVTDPSLGRREVPYEVVLKPDGCFTAEGPPAIVGDVRVDRPDGRRTLNPLYAFDGCL